MSNRTGNKSMATEARHYVSIQRLTQSSDGEGGFTSIWTTVGTMWASVNPIRAIQQYQFKSINVDATHHITTRGYTDINEKDRILFKGRFLEVMTIENIQERDFELFLTCKEVR